MSQRLLRQPGVLAWTFYDWANSAFSTTVMAGFFPLFFKQYWNAEALATESTFRLGLANSLASILIVCLAPLLGAWADQAGARKRFLLFFAVMGVLMTGMLPLVANGQWVLALVLYGLAQLGFLGGNVFYDALLVSVTEERHYDRVSSYGYAFGYLGGALLFSLNVMMILKPALFGLSGTVAAVKLSFFSVSLWWALFSLPLFFWVKEPPSASVRADWIGAGFRQLLSTLGKIRQLRITFLFLLAYWCYIDGVDTIIRMAVDYGLSIGFDANNLMVALLITQFVGFPAALLFGQIGARRGPKQGIMLAIFAYLMILIWAYRMDAVWEFYLLAVGIGLVQGGIQALSRALYARLTPRNQSAEFFGFYNMLGKSAVVLGPVFMGWVGLLFNDSRLSILAIAVLFIVGAILLHRVNVDKGHQAAASLES